MSPEAWKEILEIVKIDLRIVNEGVMAYYKGKSIEDNPYIKTKVDFKFYCWPCSDEKWHKQCQDSWEEGFTTKTFLYMDNEDWNQTETRVSFEGSEAHEDGKSLADNPYKDDDILRMKWDWGFNKAKRERYEEYC